MTHTTVKVAVDPQLLAQVERRLADVEQRIANQLYLLRVLSGLGEPTQMATKALEAMQARQAQLVEEQQFLQTHTGGILSNFGSAGSR